MRTLLGGRGKAPAGDPDVLKPTDIIYTSRRTHNGYIEPLRLEAKEKYWRASCTSVLNLSLETGIYVGPDSTNSECWNVSDHNFVYT